MLSNQAKSASGFLDTIGINTHLHYTDTVYNQFDGVIKPRLLELGVKHIRDGAVTYSGINEDGFYYQRLRELADAGIQFNLITSSLDTPWGNPTNYNLLDDIYDWTNGAIASFEGVNEPDIQGVQGWLQSTQSGQQELYSTINNDPELSAIPVIGPSVVWAENQDQLGNLSAWTDYGNLHNYYGGRHPETTGWGSGGYGSIDWHLTQAATVSGSDPVIVTETGWHNAIGSGPGHAGIPEDVEAKYIPRLFLSHFNAGIDRTYLYELINYRNQPNDRESNFGLLNNDGSPQAGFNALKNLIDLFEDPGDSFTPESLSFSLTGETRDVQHTLLQKSDGRFYLALWLGKSSWDPSGQSRIDVPEQSVALTLPRSFGMATIHQFQADGSVNKAVSELIDGNLNLTIRDTVAIVELVSPIPPVAAADALPAEVDFVLAETSQATLTPTVGNGLKATYYDGKEFGQPVLSRRDATIDFDWQSGSPAASMDNDAFTVHWNGFIKPDYSEDYLFTTTSDDGVRLWIDDQLIINHWYDQAATPHSGRISLEAGKFYSIKMDYYESQGWAKASLAWSSGSQGFEIVPQGNLYTDVGQLTETSPASI
ncbi:hypothetical protein C7271_04110 [filamentous cyanobacterium CCP5]|nr:hypothetical protein C7271_04110 [filamentous cyanobacterium CCP5]